MLKRQWPSMEPITWHQEPHIILTLTHQSRPFGYTSCLTSYKSSWLNYHWIHISSAWPQIYQGKPRTKASLESVDLPVVQPVLPSSFSLSSRKMWRWLREMVELGFRSLHNERKRKRGVGREWEKELLALKSYNYFASRNNGQLENNGHRQSLGLFISATVGPRQEELEICPVGTAPTGWEEDEVTNNVACLRTGYFLAHIVSS